MVIVVSILGFVCAVLGIADQWGIFVFICETFGDLTGTHLRWDLTLKIALVGADVGGEATFEMLLDDFLLLSSVLAVLSE